MDTDGVVGLTRQHHLTAQGMGKRLGDAHVDQLAHQPRRFRERYGTDDELLEYTDKLIAAAEAAAKE